MAAPRSLGVRPQQRATYDDLCLDPPSALREAAMCRCRLSISEAAVHAVNVRRSAFGARDDAPVSSSMTYATSSSVPLVAVRVSILLLLSGTFQRSGIVAVDAVFDITSICNRIEGLSQRQRLLCLSYPDVMIAIGDGAKMAADECRFQFRFERWNCSGSGGGGSVSSNLVTQSSLTGR